MVLLRANDDANNNSYHDNASEYRDDAFLPLLRRLLLLSLLLVLIHQDGPVLIPLYRYCRLLLLVSQQRLFQCILWLLQFVHDRRLLVNDLFLLLVSSRLNFLLDGLRHLRYYLIPCVLLKPDVFFHSGEKLNELFVLQYFVS